MADSLTTPAEAIRPPRGKVVTVRSSSPFRWVLRLIVIAYLVFLVIWPVTLVAKATFSRGLAPVLDALQQPDVIFAFKLTLSVAFWAVLINTAFGIVISLLLVRYTFPGRRALSAMIDVPLSVWRCCWSTADVRAGSAARSNRRDYRLSTHHPA